MPGNQWYWIDWTLLFIALIVARCLVASPASYCLLIALRFTCHVALTWSCVFHFSNNAWCVLLSHIPSRHAVAVFTNALSSPCIIEWAGSSLSPRCILPCHVLIWPGLVTYIHWPRDTLSGYLLLMNPGWISSPCSWPRLALAEHSVSEIFLLSQQLFIISFAKMAKIYCDSLWLEDFSLLRVFIFKLSLYLIIIYYDDGCISGVLVSGSPTSSSRMHKQSWDFTQQSHLIVFYMHIEPYANVYCAVHLEVSCAHPRILELHFLLQFSLNPWFILRLCTLGCGSLSKPVAILSKPKMSQLRISATPNC